MEFEFDPAKNQANIAKHGGDFEAASDFEWETALDFNDNRFDYGEDRFISIGCIGDRVHVINYTIRGTVIRIIGLRQATRQEVRKYEQG